MHGLLHPFAHVSPLPLHPHPPAAAAAPWDEINFVRLPPFERDEAKKLLIYGIHERLMAQASEGLQAADNTASTPASQPAAPVPKQSEPTADQVLAIERDHKDTITFLLEAGGCRPRRLLACLAEATPMTDAELKKAQPVMPGECGRVAFLVGQGRHHLHAHTSHHTFTPHTLCFPLQMSSRPCCQLSCEAVRLSVSRHTGL